MTTSRRTFLTVSGIGAASFATRPLRLWSERLGDLLTGRRADFEALRASIKGVLILPSDGAYERARCVWSFNPRTDLRPAAIVRCAEANDVVKSVAFARAQSLEIAVRGGGHDILGASTCDGGLVIDLSAMKHVEVDAIRQRARVEPGVVSGELKAATIASGLAPVLGCNPSVGVAGLTLGGGIGWFLGTHGAACDNLVSATIATASGELLRASMDSNADLYWAIRGGGGNFGIATQLFQRVLGQSTHFISSSWRDPGEADAAMGWVDSNWTALQRLSNAGTYVNYLSESSEAVVRATYAAQYGHLATLKRRYDPDNVFHRNRNIQPSH